MVDVKVEVEMYLNYNVNVFLRYVSKPKLFLLKMYFITDIYLKNDEDENIFTLTLLSVRFSPALIKHLFEPIQVLRY